MKKKNSKELQNEVLNASIVDNSISDDLICGSGLFNWNYSIKKDVKLKMIKWYNELSEENRRYVDDFRHEAAMCEYDSHCGEEL